MRLRNLLSATIVVFIIGILTISLIPFSSSACDPEAGIGIIFPEPMAQMASAVYNDKVYIFGGTNGTAMKNTIMEADPVQEDFTILDVKLPSPMNNAGAFTYDDTIFIFGGTEPGNQTRNENLTIFSPKDNTVELKPYFFEHGMEGNSIAQDGKYFYFFGNCMCPFTPGRKDAWRFDAETMELEHYPDVLPDNLAGSVAVWHDGAAYIFGGKNKTHTIQDRILKWEPGKNAEVLATHLPYPVMKLGIAKVGNEVFLIGGLTDKGMTDKVLMFDLEKKSVKTTGQLLTHPKASRACVLIRETAYLAGGDTPDGPGGGLEVVPLPVTEPEEEKDDDSLTRGDMILTLSIVSAGVIVLIVVGIYVHDFKKKDDDKKEDEDDKRKKNKK
jgi:hypothetical protein